MQSVAGQKRAARAWNWNPSGVVALYLAATRYSIEALDSATDSPNLGTASAVSGKHGGALARHPAAGGSNELMAELNAARAAALARQK